MSSSTSKTHETSKVEEKEPPLTLNPSPPNETKTLENQKQTDPIPPLQRETLENQNPEVSDQANVSSNGEEGDKEEEGEEEEEEGECGFCLFMKGGGCKDSFTAWEKCMEESEKNKEDVVEKCFEVTALLKKCMDAHSDYYEPILRAEKAAEEQVVKEMEKQTELKDKAAEEQVVKEIERETELKDKVAEEETN
ncbi:GCK [Macleaya cordata]|uniref:GCK n=1 Tax=Macleaya cordata TaxID=56857 RepID=A0A200QP50_MACCD|nr:GCK [Macleaya cordata]